MPGPSRVNILISVRDRATPSLRRTKNEVKDFRDELVKFNRRLFTASAVYATFAIGFRKAFQLADVGAQFDFFRQQFNKTFGSTYLNTLIDASNRTMDAMSIMRLATQNHARGMKKYETEKIFTLSVKAAKLLGTSTADAARKMSAAMHGLSVTGAKQFLVALNTNNQFKNMNLLIGRLTKGLNAAGMQADLFRKTFMNEVGMALADVSARTGDARELFMQLGAGMDSLKKVIGNFLARALAPLGSMIGRTVWDAFLKLNSILDETNDKFKGLRQGLVNFMQMGGGVLGVTAGLLGGFSLLALVSATLGVSFSGMIGLLTLFGTVLKAAKGPQKGWLQLLADVGTELKFYFQAFSTYKDGISTFSKDVIDRISGMSQASQNRILFIGKMFALARVGVNGFVDGIRKAIDFFSIILGKMGIWDSKTKQFTATTEKWVKGLSTAIGAVAAIMGVTLGAKFLLSKLPVVGKFFGGKGGRGPSGSANDPIYTKGSGLSGGVSSIFGGAMLGKGAGLLAKPFKLMSGLVNKGLLAFGSTKIGYAIFGKMVSIGSKLTPIFAGLSKAILAVTGSIPAMLAIATGLGAITGVILDRKFGWSDAISDSWAGINRSNDSLLRGNSGQSGVMNSLFAKEGVESEARDIAGTQNLGSLVNQMSSKGGQFDTEALKSIASGGVDDDEMKELVRGIKRFLENKDSNFVKNTNSRDQI